MYLLNRLRKSHRRQTPQPVADVAPQRKQDKSSASVRRPPDIDAIVCAARARRKAATDAASERKLVARGHAPAGDTVTLEKALVAPVPRSPKPGPQPELHTVYRSYFHAFFDASPTHLAHSEAQGWSTHKHFDFSIGRYVITQSRQVWGVAHPLERRTLRARTGSEIAQQLDALQGAGWCFEGSKGPSFAQSRFGYEVHLSRQRIEEAKRRPL